MRQHKMAIVLAGLALFAAPGLAQQPVAGAGTQEGRAAEPSEVTSDQVDGVAGGGMPGSRVRLSGGDQEIGTITEVRVGGDKVEQVVVALDARGGQAVEIDYSKFAGPHNGFYILSLTERELGALPASHQGAGAGSSAPAAHPGQGDGASEAPMPQRRPGTGG